MELAVSMNKTKMAASRILSLAFMCEMEMNGKKLGGIGDAEALDQLGGSILCGVIEFG